MIGIKKVELRREKKNVKRKRKTIPSNEQFA
jgi:hypothetical protein